ncbi:MAG: flagellar hook-associated protein FlgK, partial [Gammaproteobacteria bacterium]|nr:flagellar hook-associated protein FlgK [Gammaproteobacteria bacterium]
MGMIDSSRSALLAFQRALATTSHNIANVNTEGYSRQSVSLQTVGSTNPTDRAAPGGGVAIHSVIRSYDNLLEESVRQDSSAFSRTDVFGSLATDVDTLFASGESNISTQLQTFFSALQDVSNDPTSNATRQAMLGESEMMTARLREMDGRLNEINDFSNSRLSQVVTEISSYAQQIADINAKIKDSGENIPNDLLDTRDHLITQLSERVSVSTTEAGDGTT